ncbi:RNA-binding protein 26 isoform X2 [Magallana gigas]|uniref:RNA-binding protein 26 isoform X2 n=1 Tax=Magallana gigas TaxID=29159 RepID=UPI00333FF82A
MMLIENVEALKTWLTKTLSPISDADPASLAKYVVALVKKDKVDKDLKEVCIDQLEVFLQTKTKDFVDQLFEALNSKEYLKHASDSSTKSAPVQEVKSDTVLAVKSDRRKDSSDSKKPRSASEKGREVKKEDRRHGSRSPSPRDRRHGSRSPSPRDRRRDYDDRRRRHDDRRTSVERRTFRRRSRSFSPRSPRRARGRSRSPRDRGRSRSYSRSRSRSRPRSWSKSRSRSRSRERKVYNRQQPDSRGSTPTLDNGKYDSTSAIPTVGSAMYSIPRGEGVYSSESHPQGLPALPAPSRQRCKDYDEKGFCMRGDLCPFDHGLDPVIVEDVSIPPPPYVPGPPVIPANGAPRMPGPGPGFVPRPPPPALGPLPLPPRPDHFEPYNPEAPGMTGPPRQPFWHGPPPSQPQGTQPGGNFPPFPPPQNPTVQVRNREHLISVTVKDDKDERSIVPPGTESSEPRPENTLSNSNTEGKPERTVIPPKRSYNSGPGQGHRGYINPYHQNNYRPSAPKKPFDFSRVGGYRPPDTDNLSLEVRKIPKEFNNIMAINQHFSKFGNLTNIQVNFENDPEAALVTFGTNQEALACYRSTEPLFNNRFVKVFWHKNKDKNREKSEGADDQQQDQRSVKERLGPPIIPHPSKLSLNNMKPKTVEQPVPAEKTVIYTSSVGNITKTVYNPEAIKAKVAITSPTAVGSASFVSKIEAIKRQEEKKKEMMKKKAELQKQKHELLLKQVEQQKMLISKLEKTKSPEEKTKIMKTIDVLAKSVEKIKSELMPPSKPTPQGVAKSVTTPEEARKEILDTELELFNKEHSGEDTTALKLKLSELTKQAAAMGLLGRGRGRGRAAPRPREANTWVAAGLRGRGKPTHAHNPGSRKLDKRPKQLEVTGFDWEEREQLNQHFSKFCSVEKIDFEDEDKSAVVSFKSRDNAEKALRHCETYMGKKLIMNWYTGAKVKPGQTDDSNYQDEEAADPEVEGHVEDDLDEEALLAGDDEDEEDEESRSWRR